MGLLDKAKQAAEQAVTKTKEGVEDVQTKRELSQAYHELGKVAHELISKGDISHPRLDEGAAKITALNEKAAAGGSSTTGDGSDSYDSSQPPAMPV